MKITPVNSTTFKIDDVSYNKADVMVVGNPANGGTLSLYMKNGTFSPNQFKDVAWSKFTDSTDAEFEDFAEASAYLAAAAAVGGTAAASTGTASSNAVTLNAINGVVTTESLTTAAAATTTITITNNLVAAASRINVTGQYASASAGTPIFRIGTISAGSFTVLITNVHASAALNAVAKIHYEVL